MNHERLSILQNMPIFGGLEEDTLEYLLSQCRLEVFEPDQFLFHEGDKGDSIYIIEKGTVAVSKAWEGGSYVLAHLRRGDCVGEMELIDIGARSASVRATENMHAIVLPRVAIFKLYERDLEQFTTIQMNMGREVSRRLREADEKLFKEYVKVDGLERSCHCLQKGLSTKAGM
jgi:CRP/FNR family cyclic AMP-dependent transcriptional regulator